ncbi:putative DNA primase/helicase [Variovorax boronicumulans]|uniref:LPD7 domain-containing protein n=1 Tax=Variovorax boronicumulans TaxID=436515 RepID=UPI002782AEBD|nr:LPD7 domain-containing protein [Variovorax boronicumulans]MDP9995265.1 putative DNA primase/helicase [Variovorax boronicumulans]MDQ0006555.1 putative DNA primase/helicase [Variovorax boronicumulans]
MPSDPFSESPSPAGTAGTAGAASPGEAGAVHGDAPPAGRSRPRVPDAIERRYLRVDDRYFFPDRTLAFIDDGARIRVQTENREVLHSVVAIAEARGWRALTVKGTASFRQGMWREAVLRGIEVRGYDPTDVEVLQMQRASKPSAPSHEKGAASAPARPTAAEEGRAAMARDGARNAGAARDAAADPAEMPRGHRSPRTTRGSTIEGLLVAAAAAPYQFDPAQRLSFYVRVRTETGDRTVWGSDLERALAESASRPRIGDQVVLTRQGARPVKVMVPERNAQGELTGEKRIVMQRAFWHIETPDHVRAMEERAMRMRSGETVSPEIGRQHPPLAAAAAGLALAEQYATRVTRDPDSWQRLVQLIRERIADALAQGHSLHLPDRRPHPGPVHLHAPVRQRAARDREAPSHERA